jgi:Cytochrome c oxidase assembly protein CtaG/Cox11
MTRYRITIYSLALWFFALVALSPLANASDDVPNSLDAATRQPVDVIGAYLQALHARDSRAAYRYISALDQAVRDEKTYIDSQSTLDGFALKLARWFAAEMKIWVIDQESGVKKSRFEVGYRVPAGDEIASRLFDWNQQKLNAVTKADQQRLVKTLEDLKRSGKMVMLEGQETVDLVREANGWKVFLNWPARTRVVFKSNVANSTPLEVRFVHNDFLVAANEPLQVDFTIKNHSKKPLVAKLNHIIQPQRFASDVSLIACGLSSPFTLQPQETRELSSSYVLGGSISSRSQVAIIYDFGIKTRQSRYSGFGPISDLARSR